MQEYITEQIVPTETLPIAPQAGYEFADPVSDAQYMIDSIKWNPSKKAVIDGLLVDSGVDVVWQIDPETQNVTGIESGTDDVKQAIVSGIEKKQFEAAELYDYANQELPTYKKEVEDGLALYAANLGYNPEEIKALIAAKLDSIKEVAVDNAIAQGRSYDLIGGAAQLSSDGRMRINVDATKSNAKDLNIGEKELIQRNVEHELMHAASFHAKSADVDYEVKSGLGSMPTVGETGSIRSWTGSQLLEEGAQEQIRWRHLDGSSPSYEKSVMFWEVAMALDPSIEKDRFDAKFMGKGRGSLIGKIENIFGPGAVESIEDTLDDYAKLRTYPEWKEMLTAMISMDGKDQDEKQQNTEAARLKAREILDRTQLEIYTSRGMGYSDEQLRQLNETGVMPEEPAFKK